MTSDLNFQWTGTHWEDANGTNHQIKVRIAE